MTKEEYHQAILTHDRRMIEAMIDRIPSNVNRAGKTFIKQANKIREEYYGKLRSENK